MRYKKEGEGAGIGIARCIEQTNGKLGNGKSDMSGAALQGAFISWVHQAPAIVPLLRLLFTHVYGRQHRALHPQCNKHNARIGIAVQTVGSQLPRLIETAAGANMVLLHPTLQECMRLLACSCC